MQKNVLVEGGGGEGRKVNNEFADLRAKCTQISLFNTMLLQ